MINGKRNHHFIAHTEQIMHARSSDVSSKSINRFKVEDKRRLLLKKTSKKGVKIANNLSFEDLYCFDFLSRTEQFNFESAFGNYEEKYKEIVDCIISQKGDLEKLYIDLFTYKFMSIIRNPFCIKPIVNMFKGGINLHPVDKNLLAIYHKIEIGNKPQKKRVCEFFNITDSEYTNWLKIIFLVLSVKLDEGNLLEAFSRGMFYAPKSLLNIVLFNITDEKTTLFSDVGFTSLASDSHLIYEFPLTNKHYVFFGFTDLNSFSKILEKEKGVKLSGLLSLLQSKPKNIQISTVSDDFERLKSFNVRMIEQSRHYVFSQSTKPFI